MISVCPFKTYGNDAIYSVVYVLESNAYYCAIISRLAGLPIQKSSPGQDPAITRVPGAGDAIDLCIKKRCIHSVHTHTRDTRPLNTPSYHHYQTFYDPCIYTITMLSWTRLLEVVNLSPKMYKMRNNWVSYPLWYRHPFVHCCNLHTFSIDSVRAIILTRFYATITRPITARVMRCDLHCERYAHNWAYYTSISSTCEWHFASNNNKRLLERGRVWSIGGFRSVKYQSSRNEGDISNFWS